MKYFSYIYLFAKTSYYIYRVANNIMYKFPPYMVLRCARLLCISSKNNDPNRSYTHFCLNIYEKVTRNALRAISSSAIPYREGTNIMHHPVLFEFHNIS